MNNIQKYTKDNNLKEGVKISSKDVKNILSNESDFNIGIEYEMIFKPSKSLGMNISSFFEDDFDYSQELIETYEQEGYLVETGIDINELRNKTDTFFYIVKKEIDDKVEIYSVHNAYYGGFLYLSVSNSIVDNLSDIIYELKENNSKQAQYIDSFISEIKDFKDEFDERSLSENILILFDNLSKLFNEGFDLDLDTVELFQLDEVELISKIKEFTDLYFKPFLNGENIDDYEVSQFISNISDSNLQLEKYTVDGGSDFLYQLIGNSSIYKLDIPFVDRFIRDKGIKGNIIEEDQSAYMLEIITDKIKLSEAISHIGKVFSMIQDNQNYFLTTGETGLHVSISTNKYQITDFNMLKFVVLSEYERIINVFPPRVFVASVIESLHNAIDKKENIDRLLKNIFTKSPRSVEDTYNGIVKFIEDATKDKLLTDTKGDSVNFEDYFYSKGRIELRHFGGEGYENQQDVILDQIHSALHIMNLSYTDAENPRYIKGLLKIINKIISNRLDGLGIPELLYLDKRRRQGMNKSKLREYLEDNVDAYEVLWYYFDD